MRRCFTFQIWWYRFERSFVIYFVTYTLNFIPFTTGKRNQTNVIGRSVSGNTQILSMLLLLCLPPSTHPPVKGEEWLDRLRIILKIKRRTDSWSLTGIIVTTVQEHPWRRWSLWFERSLYFFTYNHNCKSTIVLQNSCSEKFHNLGKYLQWSLGCFAVNVTKFFRADFFMEQLSLFLTLDMLLREARSILPELFWYLPTLKVFGKLQKNHPWESAITLNLKAMALQL